MIFTSIKFRLETKMSNESADMSKIIILSDDFERVAIHSARERWCCAWPCTTCGAGEIRSAYAKMGSLPDDLRFLKIEGPNYFLNYFKFTDDHFDAMKNADFERIMREARTENWQSSVRAFALLALNHEAEQHVRRMLDEKLENLKEVERQFFSEFYANPSALFE